MHKTGRWKPAKCNSYSKKCCFCGYLKLNILNAHTTLHDRLCLISLPGKCLVTSTVSGLHSLILSRLKLITNLDKLQVGESSDVEVGRVLLQGDAVVELAVAAADGERLRPVGPAQGGRAVQPAEVGRRTKLCKHAHTHRKKLNSSSCLRLKDRIVR